MRELLLGAERRKLQELEERLEAQQVDAEAVARVLPQAVTIRAAQNEELGKALATTIEGGIQSSVSRDPGVIADAIYPVIGPAIRKSIMQAMSELVESINRTLEHSLSPKSIGWRIEALRTGRPFAEIVLKHSLVYRVEQVFLIHKETSLLIEHKIAPQVGVQDPDMVSAMLGAIQDFVVDAFGDHSPQGIAQVEFGEDVLHVAQGPKAIVACFVRGLAPAAFRQQIENVLLEVHTNHEVALRNFEQDPTPLESGVPELTELLVEQKAEKASPKKGAGPGSYVLPAILVLSLAALALYWIRDSKQEQRWSAGLAALGGEPGLVVISAERDGPGGHIAGLKDPNAAAPAELLRASGVDPQLVVTSWTPFQSLEEELVERRLRALLELPEGVELSFGAGKLTLRGEASHAWCQEALSKARQAQGVEQLDSQGLVDRELEELRHMARRMGLHEVSYDQDSPRLWDSRTAHLQQPLKELIYGADDLGYGVELQLTGHAMRAEAGQAELGWSRSRELRDRLQLELGALVSITLADPVLDAERPMVKLEARLKRRPESP